MTEDLGKIKEVNVTLDKGGPELARVVLINEDDEMFIFQMDQDKATTFANNLSRDVILKEVVNFGF